MIRRQREIYCAHVVQRVWRAHVDRKRLAAAAAAETHAAAGTQPGAAASDRGGGRRSIVRCALGSIPEQHADSDVGSVDDLVS